MPLKLSERLLASLRRVITQVHDVLGLVLYEEPFGSHNLRALSVVRMLPGRIARTVT